MNKLLALMLFFSCACQAAPTYEPGSCKQDVTDQCIDATPCKKIGDVTACLSTATSVPEGAIRLPEGCWQYQAAFTCRDSTSIDTCTPLRERGCGQVGTACLLYKNDDPAQGCTHSTLTFQCPDRPPTTRETNVCTTSLCAADGTGCFDTSHPPDKDFGIAATMMEAAREGAIYGADGSAIELFKGFKEECAVKTVGGSDIKSCCKAAGGGGAYTNFEVIGVTAKAAYAVGSEELKAGSKYVYDALFTAQDASLMSEGLGAAAGGLSEGMAEGISSQAGTTFGAYGFEFSYSAAGGFSYVGFDPYSFALSVAIRIITEWLSCEPQEQVLQMKKGQNLCTYEGSYCASKVLGVCVEKKEVNCCFNSVLAKIINRQGRRQLGLPSTDCGGFTQEQLMALDFSAMDFSEFIASINPTSPDAGGLRQQIEETVNRKVGDYYGNGD